MSYVQYGISRELVERVKAKMKNPVVKDLVAALLRGVTKADLQNRAKVRALLQRVSGVMGIKLTEAEAQAIVQFVIDQRIDPNNTFHLLRLWGMFR